MGNTFDGRLLDERQGTSFGEVAYGVFGEEGPPVVLVHGTPSRSHIWREIVGVPWASSPPHDRSYKARGAEAGIHSKSGGNAARRCGGGYLRKEPS